MQVMMNKMNENDKSCRKNITNIKHDKQIIYVTNAKQTHKMVTKHAEYHKLQMKTIIRNVKEYVKMFNKINHEQMTKIMRT